MDDIKFWEWCGLIIKQGTAADGWAYRVFFPHSAHYEFCKSLEEILTLDNLFKCAVPKLDRYSLEDDWSKIEKHFAYAEVGEKSGQAWDDNPALALRKAIEKVIESE